MIKIVMEKLTSLLVRPPRMEYDMSTLIGGSDGEFGLRVDGARRRFFRKDFTLLNGRGIAFECSHYVPLRAVEASICTGDAGRGPPLLPCVMYGEVHTRAPRRARRGPRTDRPTDRRREPAARRYMHGNAGSRVDANPVVKLLLPMGITVLALDFSGCGKSEGEYVSLGHFEQEDVRAAVRHLRSEGRTSLISLWGRSMGAVTAVLYSATDPSVAGVVLDSPFSKLTSLMLELATRVRLSIGGYTIPALPATIAGVALSAIRGSIRKRHAFDIDALDAEGAAAECYCPALFGHGDEDDFIVEEHSERIKARWAGDSHMLTFSANHNSQRPSSWYRSAASFMSKILAVGVKETESLFDFDRPAAAAIELPRSSGATAVPSPREEGDRGGTRTRRARVRGGTRPRCGHSARTAGASTIPCSGTAAT